MYSEPTRPPSGAAVICCHIAGFVLFVEQPACVYLSWASRGSVKSLLDRWHSRLLRLESMLG